MRRSTLALRCLKYATVLSMVVVSWLGPVSQATLLTLHPQASFLLDNRTAPDSDILLESAMQLEAGSLDNFSGADAIEGSVRLNTFALLPGDTISFNWQWHSNEHSNSYFNDFAFVYISSVGLMLLADTHTADFFSDHFFWRTDTAQTALIALGVMDVNDHRISSSLIVEQFRITPAVTAPPTVPVPLPPTIALLGLVLILYGCLNFQPKSHRAVVH